MKKIIKKLLLWVKKVFIRVRRWWHWKRFFFWQHKVVEKWYKIPEGDKLPKSAQWIYMFIFPGEIKLRIANHLNIYDVEKNTYTIHGITYSDVLLRTFAYSGINKNIIKIVERKDKVITIQSFPGLYKSGFNFGNIFVGEKEEYKRMLEVIKFVKEEFDVESIYISAKQEQEKRICETCLNYKDNHFDKKEKVGKYCDEFCQKLELMFNDFDEEKDFCSRWEN